MSVPAPAGGGGGEGRPDNVGILAADVYFPSTFVSQVSKHAHHHQQEEEHANAPRAEQVVRCLSVAMHGGMSHVVELCSRALFCSLCMHDRVAVVGSR